MTRKTVMQVMALVGLGAVVGQMSGELTADKEPVRVAAGRTLAEVVYPLAPALAEEVSSAVTSYLNGKMIDHHVIEQAAAAGTGALGDGLDGWTVGTAPAFRWTRVNHDPVHLFPKKDETITDILTDEAAGTAHVRDDMLAEIDLRVRVALWDFRGKPFDEDALAAVQNAVEAGIANVSGSWICTYNRQAQQMQWYNPDTGEWGAPCFV